MEALSQCPFVGTSTGQSTSSSSCGSQVMSNVERIANKTLSQENLSQENLPLEKGRIRRFFESHQDLIYVGLMLSATALLVIGIVSLAVGGIAGLVMGITFIPAALAFFWLGGSSILNTSDEIESKRSQEWHESMKFTRDHFEIIETGGDGNCLFHSLAYHLNGIEGCTDHKAVRKLVTDYMKSKKEYFKDFMEDDVTIDDYLMAMSKDGVWGGDQEVNAITSYLNEKGSNYCIIVRDPSKVVEITFPAEKSSLEKPSLEKPSEVKETRIYLLRRGNHWQALKVKPGSPR